LGIVGGVLLPGALVVGGVGFYFFHSMRQVQRLSQEIAEDERRESACQFAQTFLQDLKDDRIDKAYEVTSANYQTNTSIEVLTAVVNSHQSVIKQPARLFADINANPNVPNLVYQVWGYVLIVGEGLFKLEFAIASDNNQWKINQFSITPVAPNNAAP
jgi:hypothetical protein